MARFDGLMRRFEFDQLLRDVMAGHDAQPGRRQFDTERHSLNQLANTDHTLRVIRQRKSMLNAPRPLDKQPDTAVSL